MPAVFRGKRVGFGIFRCRANKDVSEYVGGAYFFSLKLTAFALLKNRPFWAPKNESSGTQPNPCISLGAKCCEFQGLGRGWGQPCEPLVGFWLVPSNPPTSATSGIFGRTPATSGDFGCKAQKWEFPGLAGWFESRNVRCKVVESKILVHL